MELMAGANLVQGTTEQIWFFLILHVSINNMKYLPTVWITPQPCHSHFCCLLLPILPKLDIWAKNGAYGLFGLGSRYNRAELYFPSPCMISWMIWNTSELSESLLSLVTAIFVVDCCQFGPSWVPWLKMELMACASLIGGTTEQRWLFHDLIRNNKWYETLSNCLHHTSVVPQPFFCWLLPIWP